MLASCCVLVWVLFIVFFDSFLSCHLVITLSATTENYIFIVVCSTARFTFSLDCRSREQNKNRGRLSGSPAKSGALGFGTKNNFPSFFVSEKGLTHIYKKAIYYFPIPYFCFATSQNWILAELRLPTVIRKVKFSDFVKRAMSPKIQLTEFRLHTNFKVHSLLWQTRYGNFSKNSKLTSEAGRHPTLRPLITY